jgi:CPA1 family monovalent cation:H+ antiporter
MRGIVSLAAALALPLTTSADAPFPFRSEIILITFMLILATLVLHGLSLIPLIRALDLEQDQTLEQKEAHAREPAATAALARLDDLSTDPGLWLPRSIGSASAAPLSV